MHLLPTYILLFQISKRLVYDIQLSTKIKWPIFTRKRYKDILHNNSIGESLKIKSVHIILLCFIIGK